MIGKIFTENSLSFMNNDSAIFKDIDLLSMLNTGEKCRTKIIDGYDAVVVPHIGQNYSCCGQRID